jgi:hypothetical protein
MKLSHLQEQLLLEDIILDEDIIPYCNDFLLLLEKFGQGLLKKKWHEEFNPDEEMFVRSLSKAVEELGGNIPKHKLGVFQKVIMSLMVPILGMHFSLNLGTIKPSDIAYVLNKVDATKLEKISNRVRGFVLDYYDKKQGKARD